MTPMPDLEPAMTSFQTALEAGELDLRPGVLDPDLHLHADMAMGEPRFTYVRLQDKIVTAMIMVARADPYKGLPCFNVGWVVPKNLRGHGRATEAFIAAANELRNGIVRTGAQRFYIEAVIEVDNVASRRVAEKVISSSPVKINPASKHGVPIAQYVREVIVGEPVQALG